MSAARRFEVSRAQLRQSRTVDDPHAAVARALSDGEVRLRVDSFALTSNNITYAAFGEAMKYWDFFPTDDPAWGCIPAWGFARVVESRADGLAVGERLYGYLPMATHVVVRPGRTTRLGFVDASVHRQDLAALYNQYTRCAADPAYLPAQEAQQAVLRPLFVTSFLIDAFLAAEAFFGASQVLLSSASSKTAFGTAFCLSQRRGRPGAARVLGLTSAGNLGFCRSLGSYDALLEYDALDSLDPAVATVYVDFAGNAALRRRVHQYFGASLRYSCSVGGTHWAELGGGRDLPGPRPTLFFAPAQIARLALPPPDGWGAAALNTRIAEAWQAFMVPVTDAHTPWLRVRRASGEAAVREAYEALLDGRADPREGLMLSL